MSWLSMISWRWIIRGTCLGLIVLCAGWWGLSYFYGAGVKHSAVFMGLSEGLLRVWHHPALARVPGWSTEWGRQPPNHSPFSPHLLDGDLLGFRVGRNPAFGYWSVDIPFWFLIVLLALITLFAWRMTAQREVVRGFPVEPLASWRKVPRS